MGASKSAGGGGKVLNRRFIFGIAQTFFPVQIGIMDSIVVTGLGAVTPLGLHADEIVSALEAGHCAVKHRRMDDCIEVWFGRVPETVYDRADTLFSHLSEEEQEVARNDEGLLFGLAAAEDAIQQAGLTQAGLQPHRVGMIVSSSKGLLRNMLRANHLFLKHGPVGDPEGLMARLFHNFSGEMLGRHVARRHRFTGPVLNYPSACATGLTSIIGAVNLLRDGIVDAAVVGSSESSGNAVTLASFSNMGALSPELCRPFHAKRRGFNPGEGAAVLVLEREVDARRRGAAVLGRIRGWDFRSDAYHMTAVETEGHAVQTAVRQALRRAGWDASEVDYVNAHGTGTQLNDATEAHVIETMFEAPGPLVSSLKGHIGHLLGASASVETVICMMALARGIVPETMNLDEPDPAFRTNFVRGGVAHQQVNRFMKFSLGFGGHIGVLAVEMGG